MKYNHAALDAAAAKVMGWRDEPGYWKVPLWSPSTDIAHAWMLVEHQTQRGFWFQMQSALGGGYTARFGDSYEETADTAPLAITLAFLAASGVDTEQFKEVKP